MKHRKSITENRGPGVGAPKSFDLHLHCEGTLIKTLSKMFESVTGLLSTLFATAITDLTMNGRFEPISASPIASIALRWFSQDFWNCEKSKLIAQVDDTVRFVRSLSQAVEIFHVARLHLRSRRSKHSGASSRPREPADTVPRLNQLRHKRRPDEPVAPVTKIRVMISPWRPNLRPTPVSETLCSTCSTSMPSSIGPDDLPFCSDYSWHLMQWNACGNAVNRLTPISPPH